MVRTYGQEPYQAEVIHGGPRAFGSVALVARELSKQIGVLEPIQSKHSIEELVQELYEQLRCYTKKPITLIGHSWGAWLVLIFARNYPEMVKQLILVGCGPIKAEYTHLIMEHRLSNLSKEDGELFLKSIEQLNDSTFNDKDTALSNLGRMAEKADHYAPSGVEENPKDSFETDGSMYADVWPQADALRSSGELFSLLADIHCPVTLIQGEFDPHPYEGVEEPLREQGVSFQAYRLEKCGHTPWQEKYAKDQFYKILCNIILSDS